MMADLRKTAPSVLAKLPANGHSWTAQDFQNAFGPDFQKELAERIAQSISDRLEENKRRIRRLEWPL